MNPDIWHVRINPIHIIFFNDIHETHIQKEWVSEKCHTDKIKDKTTTNSEFKIKAQALPPKRDQNSTDTQTHKKMQTERSSASYSITMKHNILVRRKHSEVQNTHTCFIFYLEKKLYLSKMLVCSTYQTHFALWNF